jgi:putative SOS response-associated peptidase YedK
MCGRFAFYTPAEAVVRLFSLEPTEALAPRYNIAPTQPAPVVRRRDDATRRLSLLRWGLIPFWAKDPAIGNRLINARAETAGSKPAFRQAYRKRRCLVLANGFYEWQKAGSGKIPWYITQVSAEPFAMAGLWESWRGNDDEPLETFTILTTTANQRLSPIHQRMPVVLDSDAIRVWLNPESADDDLSAAVAASQGTPFDAVPVSRRVNNPANEGSELVVPAV